jgi:Mg2+-importing ATPase
MSAGLTSVEAARKLAQYGPNDPAPRKQRSHLVELLLQFANPLVAILLFASAVSAFIGEFVNAIIVIVIVSLSVAVNFVQTFRSRKAADRLRNTVAPTATVLRDGVFADVRRIDVVPGDVIRLCAGDLVPADARLTQAKDLHLQQSALTGESMPVEKKFRAGDESDATMVLLGTSVVSGSATALVLATGPRTAFGDIATRLATRAPETEFDRGIKQFGLLITKAVFGLVMFILIVRIGSHRGAFESVLFAVALAVGLTPEFLPMITSDDHIGHARARRGGDGQAQGDREAPVGDSEPRQHRRSVQRQDGDADPGQHGVCGFVRRVRPGLREATVLCPAQQQVRNRDSKSARHGDPRMC